MTQPVTEAAAPMEFRRMTDLISGWSSAQIRRALWALIGVSAIAAWIVRFVQDDAFITYRYARNLARGNGLVLNPGQRVEGYTNFLWTVLMAIPEKLGWSAPQFSMFLGIAIMVLTMVVVFRFARIVFEDERLALFTVVVLVANMSFLGYGTGGLETMMQTLLVSGVGLASLASQNSTHPVTERVLAGVLGGVACLTRLDSVVIVGSWFVLVLLAQWSSEGDAPTADRLRRLLPNALQLGLPMVVVLAPWFAWKLDYYGELLPNTQAAKSAGVIIPFLYGVFYLLCFFASYAAFLLIKRYRAFRKEWFANPRARAASIVVGVWFLYICVVGADFMEFRFVVPVLPILAMFAAFLLNRFRSVRKQVAIITVLLMVSALHRVVPGVAYPVLTFKDLSHWPTESKTSWKAMGEFLADAFPGGPDKAGQPTIAVEPLGLISYFSDLPVVDMLGLADREIAHHGDRIPIYYPGHVRMATVDQLLSKGANLVVGLPWTVKPGQFDSYRLTQLTAVWSTADLRKLPKGASVVELPLTDGVAWVVIYLHPNSEVDRLIANGTWRKVPIDRTCDAKDLNFLTRRLAQQTCPGI